ncbi:MAG: MFS transporter [Chloroflexi bacterium]|nr:MFS transporter [Chloroflexota bacterium]
MKAKVDAGAKRRIYYGWVIVAVVLVLNMMYGSTTALFGLFIIPMQKDLGWSRSTIVLAITIAALLSGPSHALTGPIVDRYGSRLLIFTTALIGGLFIALGGLVNAPWQFYLLFAALGLAVLQSAGTPITQIVVAKWFVAKRGRALGWSNVGLSLGASILLPIMTLVIAQWGWRWGFVVLGVLYGIGIAAASIFLKRTPEDLGLLPDGVTPERAKAQATDAREKQQSKRIKIEQSWTLRDAMGTRTFWLLLLAGVVASMAGSATFVHVIPYLRGEKGFGNLASTAFSTWFVFSVISKIIWGYLSEKIPVYFSVIMVFIGEAVGVILLLNVGGSVTMLFVWAVVHGSLHGPSAQLQTLMWADYYGRSFLGTIRGVFLFPSVFASAGGPLLAAYIYDARGVYRLVWLISIALYFLTAFLFLLSPPPRSRQRVLKASEGQPAVTT